MNKTSKFMLFAATVIGLSMAMTSVMAADSTIVPEKPFVLELGQLPKMEDATPTYLADRVAFYATTISAKDGQLTASKTMPLMFSESVGDPRFQGKTTYSGSETLKIDGSYDQDSGVLSGTVEVAYDLNITQSWVDDRGNPAGRPPVAAKSSGSGKFKGQIVQGRALVKFNFTDTTESGKTYQNSRQVVYEIGADEAADAAAYEAAGKVLDERVAADAGADYKKDSGARFSGMNGEVEVQLPGEKEWHLVKLETVLPIGAHIRTQEESSCVIGFADMSTFVMKPETEIIVAAPPGTHGKVQLISGDVWVNFKKMLTDGSMEVKMNQAVAGIKGTALVASEKGGVSSLKVIEGRVAFTPVGGAATDVTSGNMATVGADGKAQVKQFDVLGELDSWNALRPVNWQELDRIPDPTAAASGPSDSGSAATAPARKTGSAIALVLIGLVALVGGAVWYRSRRSAKK